MGHFTLLDDDLPRAIATANSIKAKLDADAQRQLDTSDS